LRLKALQIEDFRQGNIVSLVEIIAGHPPHAAIELDRLFAAPHPSAAAQYHEAHAGVLNRQIERIESGQTKLVVILPSYGADLLAICREVTCRPA
jgi:hypothetical protein